MKVVTVRREGDPAMLRLSDSLKKAAAEAARKMRSRGQQETDFVHAKAHYKIREGQGAGDERFMGRVEESGLDQFGIFLLPNGTR